MTHLDQTNDLSNQAHPENNGTIEVQTISDGHGHVRHIVYLPGTDDLATLPWTQDGDVRDLATNLLLIRGQDNAYLDGILAAMREAGVGPRRPGAAGRALPGRDGGGRHPRSAPRLQRHQRRDRRVAHRAGPRLPAGHPRALPGEPRRRGPAARRRGEPRHASSR